jgi:hypothetical protein
MTTAELEECVGRLLDDFYEKRTARLTKLDLHETLHHKNPYLFRATGMEKASDIVNAILMAFISSSDETIFGDVFFEPLAQVVSGGSVAPGAGVDVSVVHEGYYTAIAVKSGPSVFNGQSRARQKEEFRALRKRLQKLRLMFDPLVGYCYGKKRQRSASNEEFRELAGQRFWKELTGEDNFYLKIIRAMKEKLQRSARCRVQQIRPGVHHRVLPRVRRSRLGQADALQQR